MKHIIDNQIQKEKQLVNKKFKHFNESTINDLRMSKMMFFTKNNFSILKDFKDSED